MSYLDMARDDVRPLGMMAERMPADIASRALGSNAYHRQRAYSGTRWRIIA